LQKITRPFPTLFSEQGAPRPQVGDPIQKFGAPELVQNREPVQIRRLVILDDLAIHAALFSSAWSK
jgi:hypothetical protein